MGVNDRERRLLLRAVEEAGERLTTRSEVLRLLEDEWASAEWMLAESRGLFSDGERLALLNRIAGPLLSLVREVFRDDLLLRVARLTDPVGRRGRRNLTVRQIPALYDDEPERQVELEALVESATAAAGFARDWRNRRIAHRDYSHARNQEAKPLERESLEQVDAALAAIRRLLDASLDYEVLHPTGGGAADGFVYRTRELVEAVQFVDSLIDPKHGSDEFDHEAVFAFLGNLGRHDGDYERVVELRLTARRYPQQDLSTLPRRKMRTVPSS